MNCIIPGLNLKVIAKALQALVKVGDELFIEAKKDKLTFITLNLRKTLRLMDAESLSIEISPDSGSNNMLAISSFFGQLLAMFSNSDDEITFEITKNKLIARNYIVGTPVRPKSVRSQVNLTASEFNIFQINNETTVNFSLKPFRTAIHFAEGFNLNIGLNFETGGKPLAIIMKNPSFEVNFIVATLNPYSDLQSSMATTSIPTKITQRINDNVNITVEDQEALQNENWDDFMENETVQSKPSRKSTKKASFQEIVEKAKQTNKNNEKLNNTVRNNDKRNNKKFALPLETSMEVNPELNNDLDVLPPSPESPRTKRAKLVFGRCFEPTFSETCFGEVLAPNSDSE
ncbi:hypothetical protein NQ314_005049 [Rhamnusium bicolor]|uniref:Cell cycle checkpoint control protein n=1 Tax=Rhamnusium bicolor TaxID=1586634 RepID=A0AAV8ZHH9_9CUCU|nr:hypothetical protein NQ314_005049 [Rhamnusium bicolor]